MGFGRINDYWTCNSYLDYCCAKIELNLKKFVGFNEWHSVINMYRVKYFLRSQKGNVESALVIIPLMLLFLGSLQIMAVISTRNLERTLAQDRARSLSMGIYPNLTNTNEQEYYRQSIPTYWPLDKLELVINKVRRDIPEIFPGISKIIGSRKISVLGASVDENLP